MAVRPDGAKAMFATGLVEAMGRVNRVDRVGQVVGRCNAISSAMARCCAGAMGV